MTSQTSLDGGIIGLLDISGCTQKQVGVVDIVYGFLCNSNPHSLATALPCTYLLTWDEP